MEVEVVFPQVCGAFYKATIVELNTEERKALLSFENNWKSDTWVELDYIRYLPPLAVDTFIEPGSKVEAFLPHQDNEPSGWWNGTLLKSKGPLHVVEFQSGNEKYQDIVEEDKIRLPNTNKPLSSHTFQQKSFPVPVDIQDYCTRQSVHENFRRRVDAITVQYDSGKKELTVLASSEECLQRASLLIEMHLRDLRTHKQIVTRTELVAQRISQQQQRQLESGLYEQQIYVPSDLVGLAIGREGSNVNEVRKLEGIVSVEFDDYSHMFKVRAKTPDVLTKAKELLEFIRDTVMIPRNLAGRVIGKRGHIIQEILEKSKVHNIRVVGDEEATEKKMDVTTQVPFDFIGRKTAIENAKLMLNYHLDHLRDMESILQSRREIDGQLPALDDTPNYFPAPNRPRQYVPRRRGRGRGWGSSWGGEGGGGGGRRGGHRAPPETHSPEPETQGQSSSQERKEEDVYYSSEETESEEESREEREGREEREEEEEEEEGREGSGEEQSPPESDEQGPDRRRQFVPSRDRGGDRGGYRWRGRGRGRGRGGGRGRGRGYGYRYNRPPPRREVRDEWDGEESRPDEGASGGGSAPKPQRTNRGRRREHNVEPSTVQPQSTDATNAAEQ